MVMKKELVRLRGASIKTVVEGRSIVDAKTLNIFSLDDADAFLDCYGFSYSTPEEKHEMETIRQESISFIEEVLLSNGQKIPDIVRLQHDPRVLMVWVSSHSRQPDAEEATRKQWSCALLKVMHTFAHCSSFFNEQYQKEIREQILARIKPHIEYREDGTYIGDIPLSGFECRPSKTRRSAALKLLHKAENVAADIFDWIGIRIVTRYRLDGLRVLGYLRQHHIVMFANIKPSRSRNTLIDMDWVNAIKDDEKDWQQLRDEFQHRGYPTSETQSSDNPFSEATYHAIQFTCRQRIRVKENDGRILRFFFPYEVQIMDEDSYTRSRSGMASHHKYKDRQLQAVRLRVLGSLINKE